MYFFYKNISNTVRILQMLNKLITKHKIISILLDIFQKIYQKMNFIDNDHEFVLVAE